MRLFLLLFSLFSLKNGHSQKPVIILKEPYVVVEKAWVLRDTTWSKSPEGKLVPRGDQLLQMSRMEPEGKIWFSGNLKLSKNPLDTALHFQLPVVKNLEVATNDTTGFAQYGSLDLLAELADDIDSTLRFFENTVAPDFAGQEIDGTKHFLSDNLGRVMLVNFCGDMSQQSLSNTVTLNHLRDNFPPSRLRMMTVTTWEEIDVRWRTKDLAAKPTFPVIPNGRQLMEHNFGGGLGLPRLLVIDKKGVIRKIILGADPTDSEGVYRRAKPIIEALLKE